MYENRDPTNCKCKTGVEDIVSIILIIAISITSLGLLGSFFKPSSSGNNSVKFEGTIDGSISINGVMGDTGENDDNENKDHIGEGTDTENNNNADTDTTPDDESPEENIVDLNIEVSLSVPSSSVHCAYITRDGVSEFYKMTQTGSNKYTLSIPDFNIAGCTVSFCRMPDGTTIYTEDAIIAHSETFDLENGKVYLITLE